LAKWTTACKPKEQGGIGLRDPHHSDVIMGAKIWWQCLSAPNKPWVAIWTTKHANHRPTEELIRFTPTEKGLLIWNAVRQHFLLIQQHSFWEIRNGNTALFWTDAWNQLPKLNDIYRPPPCQEWEEQQKESVQQQWIQETEQGYRQWKQIDRLIKNADNQTEVMESELQNRRIGL